MEIAVFPLPLCIIFCQSLLHPSPSVISILRYDDETEWKMSSDISEAIYTVMWWTSQYSSPIHSLYILTISFMYWLATYVIHSVEVLPKWYWSGITFIFWFWRGVSRIVTANFKSENVWIHQMISMCIINHLSTINFTAEVFPVNNISDEVSSFYDLLIELFF